MINFDEILQLRDIKKLYDYQKQAINEIDKGKNLIVSTPTASGKTLIAEYGIIKALNNNKRAIYIAPMRALASEKFKEFEIYRNSGYKVRLEIGDYDDAKTLKYRHLNFDILFATPEKLDVILRANASLRDVKFLVIDEIHFLGFPDRGPVYEILIAKLRKIFPDIQILGLSATIGNTKELADWLNASLIESSFRPVPLTEKIETKELKKIVVENLYNGNILIFTNSKKRCEELCEELCEIEIFNDNKNEKIAEEILNAIESPTEQCKLLAKFVKKGIAFHHAGLTNKQREIVEENFKNNNIKVIVATPTLAYGVNLPAHTVIIEKLNRYTNGRMSEISVLEYKQMAGRAGRPKYDKSGVVIISANKAKEAYILKKYINGNVEDIDSYMLAEPNLRFHTLSLISDIHNVEEIIKFFDTTFGVFRHKNKRVIEDKIINVIEELKEWGFVEEKEGLNLTPIGNRITQLYVDPLTAYRYITYFSDLKIYNDFDILFILCTATEMPLVYVRGDEEDKIFSEFLSEKNASYFGNPENYDMLETYKTAKMFDAWINEKSENYINSEFDVPPGLLHQKIEIGEWLAYSASEIGKILKFDEIKIKKLMEIRTRIKYGIKAELIELITIKGIGRIRARALFNAGFVDKESIRKGHVDEIAKILKSKKIAENIKEEVELI